jgi:hypothetical protein
MAEELKPEDAEVIAKAIANEVPKVIERIMKHKLIRIDCKPCGGCRGKRSIRVNIPTFYMLLYLEAFYEAIFSEEMPLCKIINDPRISLLLRYIDTARS